jgi:hypothetical protein
MWQIEAHDWPHERYNDSDALKRNTSLYSHCCKIIIIIIIAALLFWKLLAYACKIEILEILSRLMSTLKVDSALPLEALRRQITSAVIPIYSMDVRSQLIWLTGVLYFYYIISRTV